MLERGVALPTSAYVDVGAKEEGQGILVSILPIGPEQQGRVNPWAPGQKFWLRNLALFGSSLAAPTQAVNPP